MTTNNIFFRIVRNGVNGVADYSLDDVLKALGVTDAEAFAHVSLVVKDGNGCEIEALTEGDGACAPNLTYQGVNERGHGVAIGITELPNQDCSHIATHLFAGDSETETDDVLVSIVDKPRPYSDKSRRVVYFNRDTVCLIDHKDAERNCMPLDAATENQYDNN